MLLCDLRVRENLYVLGILVETQLLEPVVVLWLALEVVLGREGVGRGDALFVRHYLVPICELLRGLSGCSTALDVLELQWSLIVQEFVEIQFEDPSLSLIGCAIQNRLLSFRPE